MGSVDTYSVNERSGNSLMMRVYRHSGALVTQSAVSSIAYAVYDMDDTSTAVTTGTLTVASVIYDTLQTDSRWTTDSTGYNFLWAMPVTVVPAGDKTYQVELTFTPTSGAVMRYAVRLKTTQFYGS